jgi:hypothetical protein
MKINVHTGITVMALFVPILACTLGQTPQPPAQNESGNATPGQPSALTDAPTPSRTSTADIVETVDDFFARCPSATEVAQVDADFTIGFEYDPTAGSLACTASAGSADLTTLQKRVYQTIYVMRLLDFSRPLPWTDRQLYDWLVAAIDGIRFVDGGGEGFSYCCDPSNTIVIALNDNSIILQTDQWIDPSQSYGLMNSTLLYVHEARHNEGFGHTCIDPSRNGDDNYLDEMGAWSAQHYLALWIAQYGERAFLAAPGDDSNYYRRVALEDAQTTRSVRFCLDPAAEPAPTLVP